MTNREKEVIGSALTTIDLHDIARAAMTFGARGVYVTTPYEDQQKLARKIIDHWTTGVGSRVNPYRKQALETITVTASFEEAAQEIGRRNHLPVTTIATSAARHDGAVSADRLKEVCENDGPHILAFGTAWGLADEFIRRCDYILEPITGTGEYNHLSVRSAVSIYLDRICNH